VFSPYRSILALPGAKAFTWWGLLARAQMAMTELSILMMVQIEYGSYAVAGRVVAVVAISWVFLAPIVGRLVDRFGQTATLRWGFGIAVVGRVAMVAAALTHQPEWVLMACAPLFPASGSISTYTRSRWVHLVRSDDALNTAFSLESSLDEILFIAGPATTTILATQVASWAGLGVSTAALAVGGYAFLALRDTEPPTPGRAPRTPAERRRRLRRPRLGTHMLISVPAVLITTLIFAAQGALFASVDISTVAFADELGHKSLSGPVLALFALGSLIGGLVYGARVWRHTLASRLVWGIVLTGIGAATFGLAPSLLVLALLMFFTGLVVAPTMAVGDGMVQALVPRNRLTEGMTWTRTGIDMGIASGAWLAGYLVQQRGAGAGFVVTAVAAAASALVALLAWPYLRSTRRYEEVGEATVPAAAK
jgi:MFS family permease